VQFSHGVLGAEALLYFKRQRRIQGLKSREERFQINSVHTTWNLLEVPGVYGYVS
jgi:hypothetical protein